MRISDWSSDVCSSDLRSRDWNDSLPSVLVTGGVHGYETSGVHGALLFDDRHGADYAGKANLLVAPCVSPWAYERIHRWNPDAIDQNRSFHAGSQAEESAALMRLVEPLDRKGTRLKSSKHSDT